jgi:tRNA (Thr-GGU) A37 N-methylase
MAQSAIPTRATLRREYEATVPVGDESALLQSELRVLEDARERLRALRTTRVDLARRAAEHRRKLHDWKGKVPRALGAPPPEECPVTADMPCVAIAELVRPTRLGRENGTAALRFLPPYVRAMEGIERFEKAWILLRAVEYIHLAGARNPSLCQPELLESKLHLVLVDVVERRGRSAVDKELLIVNGIDADAVLAQSKDVLVVDIKPYLSYCEAFPDEIASTEGAVGAVRVASGGEKDAMAIDGVRM